MLLPLNLLTSVTIIEASASALVLNSGFNGTWVELVGGVATKPTAGNMAFPIWSESNRDKTQGFSPDVAAVGQVSVIYGKLRAVTDQYVGTPAPGDKLYVDANGQLTTTSAGAGVAVAVCTKAPFAERRLNVPFTLIEFVTA